jgi:RNA polymerase sigma-70 factor (ECF subfamily)
LVRRLTGDPHLADDAAQETWLAALQHAAAPALFEGLGRGWLCTVARNCVLQALRGRQRRQRREQAVARGLCSDGVDVDTDTELRERLLAAVLSLPEAYRTVVHERFFEDRMPTQIADALGLPIETVRTRLRRGLERLRAAITASRSPVR